MLKLVSCQRRLQKWLEKNPRPLSKTTDNDTVWKWTVPLIFTEHFQHKKRNRTARAKGNRSTIPKHDSTERDTEKRNLLHRYWRKHISVLNSVKIAHRRSQEYFRERSTPISSSRNMGLLVSSFPGSRDESASQIDSNFSDKFFWKFCECTIAVLFQVTKPKKPFFLPCVFQCQWFPQ